MTLMLDCPHLGCHGRVVPKAKKLGVVLGGMAMMSGIGLLLATPVGWFTLIPAALAGSTQATKLIHMKVKLWQESDKAGSYLMCNLCRRDVDLGDVFDFS